MRYIIFLSLFCYTLYGQSGIRSLNGSLLNSQRITLDTTATSNAFSTSNGVHTLGFDIDRFVRVDVGGLILPIVTKTANYTATANDYTILVSCSTANITITLPAAASHTGRIYNIKKIDATGYSVIIDGNSSETVDGYTSITFSSQNTSYAIQSNGTSWYIIH